MFVNVWDEIGKARLKSSRKVNPKDEIYFPTIKYPYRFSYHLLHLFFIISFPNCSQYLANSVVINRYRTPRLTNFRQLFFSFL